MGTLSPAMHSAIIIVDVEGFGNRERTHHDQGAVRAGIYQALNQAFTRSQECWDDCEYEDRGDGVLILVPPKVPKIRLVTDVPRELAAALHRHNQAHSRQAQIRLRLALHAGEIHRDEHGLIGSALIDAARLVDAPVLKRALARSSGVLAVIASQWMFDEVIRHAPDARAYREVRVSVKELTATAWIRLLDGTTPPAGLVAGPALGEIESLPAGPALPRRRLLLFSTATATSYLAGQSGAAFPRTSGSKAQASLRPGRTPVLRRLGSLGAGSGGFNTVVFSPDGKTLASAGITDHEIRLWHIAERAEVGAPLTGHTTDVAALAFSPDGKTLASGANADSVGPQGTDHTIRLWDVDARRTAAVLPGHTGGVYTVAFSPDGKTLASAGGDFLVRLWDVATRRNTAALSGHTGGVYSVAFSRDGKTLASGGDARDSTIRLWDVASRRNTVTTKAAGFVPSLAFSPTGKTLASCNGDVNTTIRLWDAALREVAAMRGGRTGAVWSVAFSPDGLIVVGGGSDSSNGSDGTIRLWDVITRKVITSLTTGHYAVLAVAFSHDGKVLAAAADTIKLWSVR